MIILRDIGLRRGSKQLLQGTGVTIQPGQRLALIGANGCGKSSLFSLLLGELAADSGEIEGLTGMRLAHMAQEIRTTDLPAGEYVWRGDPELARLRDELQRLEEAGNFEGAAAIHAALETIDGYSAERRVARLLRGLGFAEDAAEQPVRNFSGGWRIRLNLARALMTPSDLLLLDEPTNHLDLDATLWLQQWLQAYAGTLLMVSHDRDFIDATCERVLHMEGGCLVSYKGNYSDFERQRAERLANQRAAYEKQQKRISDIDAFVRRFRYKATRARQAQSRLKELERMQAVAPAHLDSPFDFSFPPPARTSDPLLRLDEADLGYGEVPVLTGVNLQLRPGSRYGLLGRNGAGKSTLLKSLVGGLSLLGGERHAGEHCRIGYFDQQQLEALDLEASPLLHLQRLDPQAREQDILDFLGGFDFRGDSAKSAVEPFSGGEKARLALAMVVWQNPNLLVLDEPTNHLDLEMRYALELALQAFEGALILVSHDRHMLRNSVEELLLVHGGRVEEYRDDLGSYERWILSTYREDTGGPARATDNSRRGKRQAAAARREQLRPLQQKVSATETLMAETDRELNDVESRLADNLIYSEEYRAELEALMKRQGELRARATDLEEQWLSLQEALETLESASISC
jgi:ATP-binding cassette subfamily F protein 3